MTPQAELTREVEGAGGHMILLDALCRTTHRYLDEHPHLRLSDLLITVAMYERLTSQLVKSQRAAV